jgi:hypothetical protein
MGIHDDDDDEHGGSQELAHAGEGSSHETKSDAGHRQRPHGHENAPADTPASHHGTDTQFAATHEHDSADSPDDRARHHGDRENGAGQHDRGHHRPGDKNRGGGHGDHDGDKQAEEPEAEPAITIGYEPAPSVCIGRGALCLP